MRRSGIRRKTTGLLVGTALVISGLVTPLIALAADGPYTIDGNVPDAGTTLLSDPSGNVKELGPINSNTTKIGVIHNDAVPTLNLTNPNGQVDLRQAWLDTEKDTSTNHDWLYFAWERDANSGSGFIAYEFMRNAAPAACAYDTASGAVLADTCNPWANRQGGDFMILWDQQGGSTQLWLRTWSGTVPNLTLGAAFPLNSAVSQAAYSADGFRGEAAVDLTATVFSGVTDCVVFANTIPSTVTGNSDSADYKDTILKNAPPITNCVPSSMTTAQTWVPNDSARISAPSGGALAGTVSFALYASIDCAVGGDAAIYSTTRPVSGTSPQTVSTTDAATQPAAQSASGSFSWSVSYDSTNAGQLDIAASCHETSVLTITNGGTVPTP